MSDMDMSGKGLPSIYETGAFYWVLHLGKWEIAQCFGDTWGLCMDDYPFSRHQFQQVGLKIEPRPEA